MAAPYSRPAGSKVNRSAGVLQLAPDQFGVGIFGGCLRKKLFATKKPAQQAFTYHAGYVV